MKFRISTSGCFYRDKDKAELEGMGFEFEADDGVIYNDKNWYMTSDEGVPMVISTLEGLVAFIDKRGQAIISRGHDGEIELEIYDDYRE